MVALNPDYTSAEPVTRQKNRVGDFFWPAPDRAGMGRLGSETASGKNAFVATIERRGPSLAQGGQPGPWADGYVFSSQSSNQEMVTLTFRKASLPGGGIANTLLGKRHVSVTTSQGETGQGKVGAGVPGQGVEGSAYTLKTEMVDHTGQSTQPGVINVQVLVNRDIFLNEVRLGQPQGTWIPFCNDCNTIMEDAVRRAGGDWDGAYDSYLNQNTEYQRYWNTSAEHNRALRAIPTAGAF